MAGPSVSKRLPVPVFLTGDASKTFWGEVSGTGAVTATITIYGARTSTAANGVLLATLTLSGTTKATDAVGASTATYPYYYVTTANVTGTGATVNVEVFY
jgi:aspartate/tyrosine/aromatic aminotransferase